MKHIYVSIILLLSMNYVSYSQTFSDATVKKQHKGPYIEFVTTIHNFGTITFGEPALYSFDFTNTGTESLVISNVKTTCGCTVPQWNSKPIAPGESSSITVEYDTKRSGGFSKGITVFSNAINKQVNLVIEGEVTPNLNKPILGQ